MLTLALLLVPTFAIEAQAAGLPDMGAAQNFAAAGTLTLAHTHGGSTENGVPVRNANTPNLVTDAATAITVTNTNSTFNRAGCSIIWSHQQAGQLTLAPSSAALGNNFVAKFTMQWVTGSWEIGGFYFQIGGQTVFTVYKNNPQNAGNAADYWQGDAVANYTLHVYPNASNSTLSDVVVYIGTDKVKTVTGLTLSNKNITLKQINQVWDDTTFLTNWDIFAHGDNLAPVYDPATDSIKVNNINLGRTQIYTDAPAALAGQSYVMTFTTQTVGWSNTWALTTTFAKSGGLSQAIVFCDNYIAYTDATGTTHPFADTYTNGALTKLSVLVRPDGKGTCEIGIYQGDTLLGSFDKQPVLTPTFFMEGPEGADPWDPTISDIAMYAVPDQQYGDVDGNGNINATDVVILAKYLAGWDGYDKRVNLSNADMDQDGTVTPMDEMALTRYLANWRGYEAPYIPTIVVTDRGVDNTGRTDATAILTKLHQTGKRIYYPDGTYLFNGDTLDFSGGVKFETMDGVLIRNAISNTPIVNFDKSGNLIGLMHNHLELKYNGPNFRKVGNLVSPPISTKQNHTIVDVAPYWYNDYGLQSQLSDAGWDGWHDWQWNHHDCTTIGGITDPYDPSRHPLLGWYRGDEVEVLDWTCYWLREYGMDQSILLAGGWGDTWNDPSNGQHWVYNLLNHTPNAKNMQFGLSEMHSWGFATNYDLTKASWDQMMTEFYGNPTYANQVYCYEENGKRYPVLFVWDEDFMWQQVGGVAKLKELYVYLADRMTSAGYDGLCVLGRMSAMTNQAATLSTQNVKWFSAAYPSNAIDETKSTYAERVNSFTPFTTKYAVYSVAIGLQSHDPHPSQWVCSGNTPALFKQWLTSAINATVSASDRPRMITCYNISEWHEGGAGLLPTVGDGFGYLETIRDAIVK